MSPGNRFEVNAATKGKARCPRNAQGRQVHLHQVEGETQCACRRASEVRVTVNTSLKPYTGHH
jgi:hypothetical protein